MELVGTPLTPLASDLILTLNDSQVFPTYVRRERAICKHSALAKLKEKRAEKVANQRGI